MTQRPSAHEWIVECGGVVYHELPMAADFRVEAFQREVGTVNLRYPIRLPVMPEPILQVDNLVKHYGDVQAVRGVSFSVDEGEVFGLLGPNGAGKTTTVEILEGLRSPDGGSVPVSGFDPQRDSDALKHQIAPPLPPTPLPPNLPL